MSAREKFSHLYKECFVHLPYQCAISHSTPHHGPMSSLAHCLVSTPLQGSTSSLTHCPVSASDTIFNGPSPPLVDIVLFGLSLKVFKTRMLGRGFHILIKNDSFSSPIYVRSHNPHYSGPNVLVGTLPGVHPPSRLTVLAGTPPGVWL